LPLFDPRPKTRREDLYDRDRELEALQRAIAACQPLVVLVGPRRCGKTSLLQVALSSSSVPSIVIDCRVFEGRTSVRYADLLRVLENSINEVAKPFAKLLDFLKRVKGIRVLGTGIEFESYSPRRVSLSDVLKAVNDWGEEEGKCVVIAFDEAQELSKLRGTSILPVVAHAYDYLRNLCLIFTGSMVGMLYRFLKLDNPSSPLYGRSFVRIELGPFTKEESRDFLHRGFREYGLEPPSDVIEYAVEKLGGIPGWLTLFGYTAVTRGRVDRAIVDEVLDIASSIALEELKHFLELRYQAAKRYVAILKAIAQGFNTWSKIKRFLEIEEGARISDSDLYLLLKNLIDASIIRKTNNEYIIHDPALKYAILKKGSILAK